MKRKRFSTEQIVAAPKQVELGLPVADLSRRPAEVRHRQGFLTGHMCALGFDLQAEAVFVNRPGVSEPTGAP